MSFSYSSTDTYLNRSRLLVSDTDSTNYLFSDEEIALYSKIYGENEHRIAAAICRSIAASRALQARYFSLHDRDISIDNRDIPKYFLQLAEQYEKTETNTTLVEYLDSIDYDVSKYGVESGEFIGSEELY